MMQSLVRPSAVKLSVYRTSVEGAQTWKLAVGDIIGYHEAPRSVLS